MIFKQTKEKAEELKEDVICLISLGPTATVLAYDLANIGVRALDLGHFTSHYLRLQGNSLSPEELPFIKN